MSTTPGPGSEPDEEGPETVTVLVDGGRVSAVTAPAAASSPNGTAPETETVAGVGRADSVEPPADDDEEEEEDDDDLGGPPTPATPGIDFDFDDDWAEPVAPRPARTGARPARTAPSAPAPAPPPTVAAPPAWEAPPRPAATTPVPPKPARARRRDHDRDGDSFVRRHVLPPAPSGIVVIVLLVGAITGFTGAYIWADRDAGNLRTAPAVPPPVGRPTADATEPETTTTTRPDLSPESLAAKLSPSVWTVSTFNSSGLPVQGSAFVAGSAGGQGLLITSLAVVETSTRQPIPEITVAGAGFTGPATLWTWDEGRDLALLVVGRTGAAVPAWIADAGTLKEGDKVFAVGGDGRVAPGLVTGAADNVVQHNVFVDEGLRGGPLVNVKGDVVAVSSANYTAGGKPTDTTFFAIPIANACSAILRCGSGRAAPDAAAKAATTTTKPR